MTFAPSGDATTVTIRQTGWERLGAAGAARRDRTRSGWQAIVANYPPAAAAQA